MNQSSKIRAFGEGFVYGAEISNGTPATQRPKRGRQNQRKD
jgi:hypothetical protein